MNSAIKKFTAILLILLVLFFTVISILGIWGIIRVDHVFTKSITTLLVIFVSSAIILFIVSVIMKSDDKP
ncbi:MAG: hypothetical protein AB1458_01600 [Bacteroidota bacterium]